MSVRWKTFLVTPLYKAHVIVKDASRNSIRLYSLPSRPRSLSPMLKKLRVSLIFPNSTGQPAYQSRRASHPRDTSPNLGKTAILLLLSLLLAGTAATTTVTDIQALLSFKSNLHDPLGSLNGWNTSTPSAPCDWRGVSCSVTNNITRVHELRLNRLHLSGQLTDQIGNLDQLRKLSLYSNSFNGSIPTSFSQCSLLRVVYLHYNSFTGVLPPAISNLTNLQVLNLAHNFFSGELSGNLPVSLRYLDISSNTFSGNIPANISVASNLELINLSFNLFSGQIPATIGNLQALQYLWLDSNRLFGTLPSSIGNCSSLIHFSAGDNNLRGLIPASFGLLPNLQVISLSRNSLLGSVPTSLFFNVNVNPPSIRIVQLGFNAFTGLVKPPNFKVSSIVEVLDLHENQIKDVFPYWLTNMTTLQTLDLSSNFFSGALPAGIGNLLRLEELKLANNSFTGEVPNDIRKCGLLRVLDLGENRFSGLVPDFIGDLKGLKFLSLGSNLFNGSIPSSYGSFSKLESLDLSDNHLTGALPLELTGLSNLTSLNLSKNKFSGDVLGSVWELKGLTSLNMSGCGFSGRVPSNVANLVRLTSLDLSKQNFSGELPVELFGMPSLKFVALEENNLSGNVPQGFSSLSSLQHLNLSSNAFSGSIPAEFGFLQSLIALSLSNNLITGSIPVELGNASSLEVLEIRGNHLTGQFTDSLSRLVHLEKLDLGRNSLTGEIPGDISEMSSLTSLLLDTNQISGHIPDSLSKLSNLTDLVLSSNNLSGEIPESLSLIPGLKHLNLSNNDLEGEISEKLGSRFNDPSVFLKNKRLCGRPLKNNCKKNKKGFFTFIFVVVAGGIFLALFCCGYLWGLLRWRKKLIGKAAGEKKPSPGRGSSGTEGGRSSSQSGVPKLVMFSNRLTYAETVEATRQFDEENVLSRGKYGIVFKATFPDGMVLAIRRLPDTSIPEATYRKEAEYLGKVKHRNLTVLRGYFVGQPDVRFLVYDYMPNGNLATLLQEASHQDGHVLNWPMRHLIALGIARGLAFLHSVPLVHGDIKPQNVLFDADFEAHLTDFGLDKLTIATPAAESSSSTTPVSSLGYVPPEVALTGQVTKEADTYSFGIVLLEILTGKKPVMFSQEDEDIVKWVKRQLQKGQISELVEPGLLELDPESSEWEEFLLGLKVGLLCTGTDPTERPSMTDVVFMLEGCRVGPDIPSSADPTSLPSPS